MTPKNPNLQVFVQSPDLQIHPRALTLNPNLSLRNLKLSLLSPQTLDSTFFTLNGKPLSDSATIGGSRIAPLSTLNLHARLLGGGGDGGATGAESRDCYLNMYATKKPDRVDPNEQRLSKWLNCSLSNEPLKLPVVVDFLGNLFNKEALVEALLGKKLPKYFGHIRGLKDMVVLKLSTIPGLDSDRGVVERTRFQCPVTGLEFNGKYRFYALRTCGHVLSAKALKEVRSSSCIVCHEEFTEPDRIAINGSEEEVAALRERMEAEGKARLRERKAKKVRNGEAGVNGEEGTCIDSVSRLSGKKHGIDVNGSEKCSAKVEVNGKVGNGGVGVKSGSNGGAVKRFKAGDMAPANSTSAVYASLFTSSKKSSDFKETYSCRSLPLGRN